MRQTKINLGPLQIILTQLNVCSCSIKSANPLRVVPCDASLGCSTVTVILQTWLFVSFLLTEILFNTWLFILSISRTLTSSAVREPAAASVRSHCVTRRLSTCLTCALDKPRRRRHPTGCGAVFFPRMAKASHD